MTKEEWKWLHWRAMWLLVTLEYKSDYAQLLVHPLLPPKRIYDRLPMYPFELPIVTMRKPENGLSCVEDVGFRDGRVVTYRREMISLYYNKPINCPTSFTCCILDD